MSPDERRASILDAATELFVRQGPGFTTTDLADAVGVSEATVFRYFPDKASLVAATREALLDIDSLVPTLEAARELPTLIQRLAAAGHALAARLERMAQVLAGEDHPGRPGDDIVSRLISALAPLFDDDPVPGLSSDQLASMFLGTLLANTMLRAKTGAAAIDIDRLIDLVLHGIGPRPPRSSA